MIFSFRSRTIVLVIFVSVILVAGCTGSKENDTRTSTDRPAASAAASTEVPTTDCDQNAVENRVIALAKAHKAEDSAGMFREGQSLAALLDPCIEVQSGEQKDVARIDQAEALYNAAQGAVGLAAKAGLGSAESKKYLNTGLSLIDKGISIEQTEIESGSFNNETEKARLSDMKDVRDLIVKALR